MTLDLVQRVNVAIDFIVHFIRHVLATPKKTDGKRKIQGYFSYKMGKMQTVEI